MMCRTAGCYKKLVPAVSMRLPAQNAAVAQEAWQVPEHVSIVAAGGQHVCAAHGR